MLQSLLQPHRGLMIGALPAVAVRHQRRPKRAGARRPSQLPLPAGAQRPEPEPVPSPAIERFLDELYFCTKVGALHVIVCALLLGIVILVVGLVQLSPGAEAAQHRYYLIVVGAGLVAAGILAAVTRCVCLHCFEKECEHGDDTPEPRQHHKSNLASAVEGGHCGGGGAGAGAGAGAGGHSAPKRAKLKSQASRDHGPADLIKQPSATSDT